MSKGPLSELQLSGIRYQTTKFVEDDERALDAYIAAGVYRAASVPTQMHEPRFPEAERTGDPELDLGILNGEIADTVAAARRRGKGIVMTGGNCTHITGIIGGLQDAHSAAARIGLVWFDAHGDFNTPYTTPSGMMGGMPVAVCAGLAFPKWREGSHIVAPLPTDRIIMVDVRNLDPPEEQLVRSVGIPILSPAAGFPGDDLQAGVTDLADCCDMLYLHIDADILDESYVPDHATKEPNGPNMEQVLAAVDTVMATGKVVAFAVVSVYGGGPQRDLNVNSGIELIRGGLESWHRHGMAAIPTG